MDNNTPFTASLISCRQIGPGTLEVRLARPSGFTFLPGQFIRVFVDGSPRDYTIISDPNGETIDFCIGLVKGGRFSTLIETASQGDRFHFSGPHGHFIFRESSRRSVFVATGTGVAPFVAFSRSGVTAAILLHGVHDTDQLLYRQQLESRLDQYVPCISGIGLKEPPQRAFHGRVTAYLETVLPHDLYNFYLCGRNTMIREATALIDDQFAGSRVYIENFD